MPVTYRLKMISLILSHHCSICIANDIHSDTSVFCFRVFLIFSVIVCKEVCVCVCQFV